MGLCCGAGLGLLLWVALFTLSLGAPSRGTYWAKVFWDVKSDIAHQVPSPRILIVSGSNASGGISAKTLTGALGIPVFNIAVCQGYQLKYILDLTRTTMQAGDMILFAPEYDMYYWDGEPSEFQVDYICAWDPGYYRRMSLREQLEWVISTDGGQLLSGIRDRVRTPTLASEQGLKSQLNEYGDFVANTVDHQSDLLRQYLRTADPFEFPETFSPEWYGSKLIAEFAAECERQGVKLVATFPSLLDHPRHREGASEFYQGIVAFYESLGVTVAGTPQEYLYGPEYLFDSLYHLNEYGVPIRTATVLGYLNDIVPAWLDGMSEGSAQEVSENSTSVDVAQEVSGTHLTMRPAHSAAVPMLPAWGYE